jgi:N-acetylglucosamine-6-phosphate deacetylase
MGANASGGAGASPNSIQPAAAPAALVCHARRYDTAEPVRVEIRAGRIASVAPAWPDADPAAWPFVAPGLFDLQVNGHGGIWFSDSRLAPQRAAQAIRAYLPHGVARLCPTLITNSFEGLAAGFTALRAACEQDPAIDAMVAGFHLEGPYISAEDGPRGAHPRQHVRPCDWHEFEQLQQISGGRIRLVTVAPESAHAPEFIARATRAGVTVAIGHTAATSQQIDRAVVAGAVLSTHLGNGAHPVLPRHPNYIWDQLGDPRLAASVIADGLHLPPAVLRSILFAKTHRRVVLTCDASGWAGCAPGRYQNELGAVDLLPDGRIVVADQPGILAGSGCATDQCVANVAAFNAATLPEAIDMACRNPARLLGFPEYRLMAGDPAHLFFYRLPPGEARLEVLATIVGGRTLFGTLEAG